MKISYEFKIGLMAVVVVALSIWGFQFLKGRNLLKTSNEYFVSYANISSLASSSPILVRGMNVGIVSSVELAEDMQTIIATLKLNKGIRIPKDAEAVIVSTGLMGGKAIDLRISGLCSGAECAEPGTYLKGSVQGLFESLLGSVTEGKDGENGVSTLLNTIGDSLTSPTSDNEIAKTYTKLSQVIKNLASITTTLDQSMAQYDKHLRASLANVEVLTGTLAKSQDKIANSISNFESITKQFDEAKVADKMGVFMTDAQVTMKTLNSSVAEANQSFAQLSVIMKDLQSGKGTMGKLLKDQSLYDNLNRSSKNLDFLLQDFRLNPKRYVNVSVFGKKQKDYNVPEDDPAFKEEPPLKEE